LAPLLASSSGWPLATWASGANLGPKRRNLCTKSPGRDGGPNARQLLSGLSATKSIKHSALSELLPIDWPAGLSLAHSRPFVPSGRPLADHWTALELRASYGRAMEKPREIEPDRASGQKLRLPIGRPLAANWPASNGPRDLPRRLETTPTHCDWTHKHY